MLDTVVISGDDVCCSVVLGTLVGVFVFVLIPFMVTCSMMRFLNFTAVSLCCVCGHVVVFGLSVRLLWYPMWMRWFL